MPYTWFKTCFFLFQESSPKEFKYSFGNSMIKNSLQIQSAFYARQTKEADKLRRREKETVSATTFIEGIAATTGKLRQQKQRNLDMEHGRLMAEQEKEQQQQMLSRER